MTTDFTRPNYRKAISYMLIAYLSIAVMGVFVKIASANLPADEILFSRFVLGTLFLFPLLYKRRDFRVNRAKLHFFILRNLAGIASMLSLFYSIKHLPVSISVLLMNTSALFVPVIVYLCFGIKTSIKQLCCIFLGFLGVCVILYTNSQQQIGLVYALLGLGGAILAAIAYCSVQELNKTYSPQNIVFYFHLIGALMIGVFFFPGWVMPSYHEVVMLLSVGVFGLIFQIFMTKSFKYASAEVITPFMFVGVIFSGICDRLVWGVSLSYSFWSGAALIVLAISGLAKVSRRKR
ncbi:DMT family transporter [Caviibacterium pharyngocola]|uniref:EamA/RhaT family transporter n=1 Tax=Caviibacterium pharyngocola TaxID=28159 RepID=A0A2M8RYJ1_9PAST|nr:EamA/RhaT family transporter [Caviibacterium pharyngocola]